LCGAREGISHGLPRRVAVRAGNAFGLRSLFDAAAPLLPGFQAEPGFVF
jgi:hypothetical protein